MSDKIKFSLDSVLAEANMIYKNAYRYYSFWHQFNSENDIVKVLREMAMKQLWEIYKSVENVLSNLEEIREELSNKGAKK